jgi:hypothetical protein
MNAIKTDLHWTKLLESPGLAPADISVLLVALEQRERSRRPE